MNNKKLQYISVALTILFFSIGGFFLYIKHKNEEKAASEASYLLSKVPSLIDEKQYDKALKLNEEVAQKFKDTPFYILALSNEISLSNLGNLNIDDAKLSKTVADKSKDIYVKDAFLEREAYAYYKKNDFNKALDILKELSPGAFNKPSSLLLEAEIYEKLNNIQKAKSIYEMIFRDYPSTYYGYFAKFRYYYLGG